MNNPTVTARKTPDAINLYLTKDGSEKLIGMIIGDTLKVNKNPKDIFRKKPSIAISHAVLTSTKLNYTNIEFYIGDKVYSITRQRFWQNSFILCFPTWERQSFCPLEHFFIREWQEVTL